jgi:AcrR family transcriptional regulator
MRRKPQQTRSQQRVDHLLDTAATVFEEVGYEAATTNAIAARASVPIGSLYQFFPNKESIMEALVERYLHELQPIFTYDPAQSLSALMSQLIDNLVLFKESHAGFEVLFLDADISGHIHHMIIEGAVHWLTLCLPNLEAPLRQTTALTLVGIAEGMFKLPNIPPAEIKLAIRAYLRAVLVRASLAVPPDLHDL